MDVMFALISKTGGGAEKSSVELARELSKSLVVGTVYVRPQIIDEVEPFYEESLDLDSNGILKTFKALLHFRKIVKLHQPSIIHAHCELPEIIVVWSTLFLNVRLRVTQHSPHPFPKNWKLLGLVTRALGQLRNVQWFTPQPAKRIAFGLSVPRTLPNTVYFDGMYRDGLTAEVSGPFLCFIGRLHPEKNPILALEIARRTGVKNLVFLGDGPLRESLTSDTEINVIHKGFVKDPWSCAIKAKAVIVTSHFEADGLVIVEAIMRNVPLLVLSFPGIQNHKLPTGSLCQSPEEMIDKISNLYDGAVAPIEYVDFELAQDLIQQRSPMRIANLYREIY